MYAEKYEKAIALFGSDVMKASRYSQQAEWHRALALLKSGNMTESKAVLTLMADQVGHFKQEAASRLLEKME